MPGNSSIDGARSTLQLAYAQGRSARSVSAQAFDATLAQIEGARSVAAAPGTGAVATHLVTAGQTLCGIAGARLAAGGHWADASAAMRYALQIARENGIRDPDRIRVGQSLVLAPVPGMSGPGRPAPSAGQAATAPPASHTHARTTFWESRIVEPSPEDDADALAFDLADAEPTVAPQRADVADTAAPAVRSTDAQTRIALTRYGETAATVAADHPSVAEAAEGTDPAEPPGRAPDILYKGLIGKALDALPMDASARTGLQQANAIVGSSLAGRSLAALTGVGGPILTLAGLVWGIFSARQIAAAAPADAAAPAPQPPKLTAARN